MLCCYLFPGKICQLTGRLCEAKLASVLVVLLCFAPCAECQIGTNATGRQSYVLSAREDSDQVVNNEVALACA